MTRSSRTGNGDEHADTDQGSSAETAGGHRAHRQRTHAAELSDRAAEYVDRRYDATKEMYLDEREGRDGRERERERERDDSDTDSDTDSDPDKRDRP